MYVCMHVLLQAFPSEITVSEDKRVWFEIHEPAVYCCNSLKYTHSVKCTLTCITDTTSNLTHPDHYGTYNKSTKV